MEPQVQFGPNGRSRRHAGGPDSLPLEPEEWLADRPPLAKLFNWYEESRTGSRLHLPTSKARAPVLFKDLIPISDAIKKSRQLLRLQLDWDGEDSPRISEETWRRATDFLWNQAKWLLEEHDAVIDTPKIAPGPGGSIDIYWKTDVAELLVNIPVDQNSLLSFYGDTKAGSHISGSMKDSDYKRALWSWLTEDSASLAR